MVIEDVLILMSFAAGLDSERQLFTSLVAFMATVTAFGGLIGGSSAWIAILMLCILIPPRCVHHPHPWFSVVGVPPAMNLVRYAHDTCNFSMAVIPIQPSVRSGKHVER
jgi:hypothetical protein